jgi:hypothetical protein
MIKDAIIRIGLSFCNEGRSLSSGSGKLDRISFGRMTRDSYEAAPSANGVARFLRVADDPAGGRGIVTILPGDAACKTVIEKSTEWVCSFRVVTSGCRPYRAAGKDCGARRWICKEIGVCDARSFFYRQLIASGAWGRER